MVLSYLILFTVVLVLCLLKRRRDDQRYFEKFGIPTPPAHLLWGHYDKFRENHIYWFEKWSQQYGDNFGIFMGTRPILVSSDLDLAQRVMVKDFGNFVNRASLFVLEQSDPMFAHFISFVKDDDWRRHRKLSTPAFTSKNMKEMLPLFSKGADDFILQLKKQNSGKFDLVPLVSALSIDNIGRSVCGIDANAQNEHHANVLLQVNEEIHEASMNGIADLLTNTFEFIGSGMKGLIYFLTKRQYFMRSTTRLLHHIEKIIEKRREGIVRNDLLQKFIDAADERNKGGHMEKSFTNEELVSSAGGSFFVGFDTTSILLSYLFFCLGKHVDVQERLRKELIEENLGDDVDYGKLMNHKYLDNVVSETLRLYPPATGFNTRVASNAFRYGENEFPAGTSILFPNSVIQRDPRHWEDPLEFNPDRFLNRSNHPLAYQPFGDGPRSCIGMRLALMSTKVVLAKVLPKFRFVAFGEVNRNSENVLCRPGKVVVTMEQI